MKKKSYLVTGGTGFIGSALVKRMLDVGHTIRILDNNSRGVAARLADVNEDIEIIVADIRDAKSVNSAAHGMDGIIHLAYINGTEFFYSKPELVLDIALRGMLNIIDASRSNDIGDLVLASSSEVYQTPSIIPTPEDVQLIVPDILNPRFSYGGGKIACELMAINYGRSNFDRVTIFRPHNVYGPDMGWEHVLPQFVVRALQAIDLKPFGVIDFPIQVNGQQTRAFVHIDDFTSGVMQIIEYGGHLEIYHVGNPEEITVKKIAEQVFKVLGRESNIIQGPLTLGSTFRRCPDIAKLKELGYSPKISFEEGLPTLVKWYEKNFNSKI